MELSTFSLFLATFNLCLAAFNVAAAIYWIVLIRRLDRLNERVRASLRWLHLYEHACRTKREG